MNIGWQLSPIAKQMPDHHAVVEPAGRFADGTRKYRTISFRELETRSTRIATGLQALGISPETRIALLVRPGIDFVTLVFSLFKSGAVTILIDPGMGREHLVNCLSAAEPEGFVAIPLVHAVRVLKRNRFPQARFNVTLGRRWFWGGTTVKQLEKTQSGQNLPTTGAQDSAAIIFTTGSTGAPKGVLYSHDNFAAQVAQIRDRYQILPGEIDLAGFPLFGLFNSVMGVTTVFPEMDFTRPADVDPANLLEHADDWKPTQSFGSPALWNTVGRYCERHEKRFPTIRRVLSAGAPVPPHVVRRIQQAIAEDGEIHTPYGATEALPIASVSGSEILGETAASSETGAGTCVGTRFEGITWNVIRITDEPIADLSAAEVLSPGEIGELIVQGPVVTREYVTRLEANALAKIADTEGFWHRMGDCGYLDQQERFWFCGRKSHRVQTTEGTMFTVPCEAIANGHPDVFRSALVGIADGEFQTPVMIVELWPESRARQKVEPKKVLDEVHGRLLESPLTRSIRREHVLLHPAFPVDIRHNAKIFREKLGPWAEQKLACSATEAAT